MISAQATQANRRDRNTLETDNAPESKGARTDGEVQADQPKARALLPLKGAGLFVPERGNVPVLLAARSMEAVCCYAGKVHSPAGAV